MMRWTLKIICALASVGLGGCKTTEGMRVAAPTSEVSPTLSRLVLYQDGNKLIRVESQVMIDGVVTCGIAPGEALVWEMPPGEHDIRLRSTGTRGSSVLTFATEPSRTSYISAFPNQARLATGILGAMIVSNNNTASGGHFAIEEVSEELGKNQSAAMTLAGCPYAGRSQPAR